MTEASDDGADSNAKMVSAIPSLPVSDIERSVSFYRDTLGFSVDYRDDGFAIVHRDDVEIHLWAATDEDWRTGDESSPMVSGAESFIAGTASCRVGVETVDVLHASLHPRGIIHPNAPLRDTEYGTREFTVVDPDHNAIAFFERD